VEEFRTTPKPAYPELVEGLPFFDPSADYKPAAIPRPQQGCSRPDIME
jgi:hypothetical protein